MTALLLVLIALISFQAGTLTEWRRVLRYLDRHLDRDPDWLRSGIAEQHHIRRKRGTP